MLVQGLVVEDVKIIDSKLTRKQKLNKIKKHNIDLEKELSPFAARSADSKGRHK